MGLWQAAGIMVRGGVHKKMAGAIIIGRNLVQSTEEFKRGLIKIVNYLLYDDPHRRRPLL